jgi:serine/threonine protein phosphatase 1
VAVADEGHFGLTYAIGDIHGCLSPLKRLISALDLKDDDSLVFIGDYVDRGPNPRGVIDFLIALSANYECHFIRGNHEQMFLDYLNGVQGSTIWAYNGMETTIRSYGTIRSIPEYHIEFLNNTVLYYEEKSFIFVHAGVRPGIPLKKQDPKDLLWIREPFLESSYPIKGRTVVYGHTPLISGPLIQEGKIGIDTGCVYGGFLTAYRVDDNFYLSERL